MANWNSLTPEQEGRIKKLPVRQVKLGGETKAGYYDEENNVIYPCDANGNLTGSKITIQKPGQNNPTPTNVPAPPTDNDTPEDVAQKRKKTVRFAGVVVAVLLATVVGVTIWSSFGGKGAQPIGVTTPVESATPAEEKEDKVVLKAVKPLVPGKALTADDLSEATISGIQYEQFAQFGQALCLGVSKDQIIGCYVTKYIAPDSYLPIDNVSISSTIDPNPWKNSAVYTWTIALDDLSKEDTSITFGSVVDVDVRSYTVNQVPGKKPNSGASSSYTETTITEEFSFADMVVVDILNANGESLYNTYSMYAQIPVPEMRDYIAAALRGNSSLSSRLTPHSIVVAVDPSNIELITQIMATSYDTATKSKNYSDISTPEKLHVAEKYVAVRRIINNAIAYNVKLDAEARAEKEKLMELAAAEQASRG